MLKSRKDQLLKAIESIDWNSLEVDKPEVTDEMAYMIFGDDLSIEMTDEELMEMFLFEL